MKKSILLFAFLVGGTILAGGDETAQLILALGKYQTIEGTVERARKNLRKVEKSNSTERGAELQKASEAYETATKKKEQLLLQHYKLAAYVRDEACEE